MDAKIIFLIFLIGGGLILLGLKMAQKENNFFGALYSGSILLSALGCFVAAFGFAQFSGIIPAILFWICVVIGIYLIVC